MTGGPAQAKLCCYNGWLRPQICKEEKVTYNLNKLPCMDIGLLKNLEQVELFYLSFHSHPIYILSMYPPNAKQHGVESMESCDTKVDMAMSMTTFL
jgi:hypothetical protein